MQHCQQSRLGCWLLAKQTWLLANQQKQSVVEFEFCSNHLLPVDNWRCRPQVHASTWSGANSLERKQLQLKNWFLSKCMQVKPVEGPSNFMHITEGCNNMKLQAQASARWLPKHSWNRHANDEGSNNRSGAHLHWTKRSNTVLRITFIARTRCCSHSAVLPSKSLQPASLSRL